MTAVPTAVGKKLISPLPGNTNSDVLVRDVAVWGADGSQKFSIRPRVSVRIWIP